MKLEPEICPACNGVGRWQIARWNSAERWHYESWSCQPCKGTGNKSGRVGFGAARPRLVARR
jgi:DnaJ-class molecular chaperone